MRHDSLPATSGHGRIYLVDAAGAWSRAPVATTTNSWQYDWGYLVAKCLGQRDVAYGLAAMYLEYANVASPADTVTPPSFAHEDGRAYFDALAATPDRDYLRIPLRSTPAIDAAPGYEAYFTPGTGNRLTLFALSSGTVGANGKPFSSAANSRLYGIAVVATPVFADRTRDVIFLRAYYDPAQQPLKPPSSQFGVEHGLVFG